MFILMAKPYLNAQSLLKKITEPNNSETLKIKIKLLILIYSLK